HGRISARRRCKRCPRSARGLLAGRVILGMGSLVGGIASVAKTIEIRRAIPLLSATEGGDRCSGFHLIRAAEEYSLKFAVRTQYDPTRRVAAGREESVRVAGPKANK